MNMDARLIVTKKAPGVLDRPLSKGKGEVSLSAFAFLFSEMVQYSQKRVGGVQDLEKKLSEFGYHVGIRVLELNCWRDRNSKRETRVLGILGFIVGTVFKSLFGKPADSLEKGVNSDDEYMIQDNESVVNTFISVPREMSSLNCGAFVAGVVEAVLERSQFPARVTAHSVPIDGHPRRTTILIKFDRSVIEREKKFETR